MELRLQIGDAVWRKILQPYLFAKEPEEAHQATIRMLKRLQDTGIKSVLGLLYESPYAEDAVNIGGVVWRNRVGIAAGFDKQCEVVPALDRMGFGAIEIGTMPPLPQEGNPKPRVFRYPDKKALINRYGFNSVGAEVVAWRLKKLHQTYTIRAPIGVSIGKNKETSTDPKAMAHDYYLATKSLLPVLRPERDYLKVNISSPNTPGLRDTFSSLDAFLGNYMDGLHELTRNRHRPRPPIYLKVPPDNLSPDDFAAIVTIAAHHGIGAIEATNTTTSSSLKEESGCREEGGLSGEPLRKLSTQALSYMRETADEHGIDLIGVGGISSPEHATEKMSAGAKAVQIYTGLVYQGPGLLHRILETLYNQSHAHRQIRMPFYPGINVRVSS